MARAIKMTESMARAAARDVGDRAMRAAGRSRWSADDWNAAAEAFDRLWPREARS